MHIPTYVCFLYVILYHRSIKEEKIGAQSNEKFSEDRTIYNERETKTIFHKIVSSFFPKRHSIKKEANPVIRNQEIKY
jgi:hypothetical protein